MGETQRPNKQEIQAELRQKGLDPRDWNKSVRRVENPALFVRSQLREFTEQVMPDVGLSYDESSNSNGSSLLIATRRLQNGETLTFPVGVISPGGEPYSYLMPFNYGWSIGADSHKDE